MGLTPNLDPAANYQLYSRENAETENIVAQIRKLQNVWMPLDYTRRYQIKWHLFEYI